MTVLTPHVVTLYSIRNDDDGTRDHAIRRAIIMALRWNPPGFDQTPGKKGLENPPGIRLLHDLDDGQRVTEDRIRLTVDMLVEARRYYSAEHPPEPYEGRNREAAGDMTVLIDILRGSLR